MIAWILRLSTSLCRFMLIEPAAGQEHRRARRPQRVWAWAPQETGPTGARFGRRGDAHLTARTGQCKHTGRI